MRTGRQTLWGEADDAWAAVPSTVPMPATIVQPRPAPGINEVQLDPSTYGTATAYCSDITAAWRYATAPVLRSP
jgi:hypothetical protein